MDAGEQLLMPRTGSHVSAIGDLLSRTVVDDTLGRWALGAAGAVIAWLSPGDSLAAIGTALIALVVADFATGIRVALRRGEFISSRLWNRLADKAVAYGGVFVLAIAVRKGLPDYPWLAHGVELLIALVAAGEAISILENVGRLGVPVAGRLARALKVRLRQAEDDARQVISGEREPAQE